MILNEHLSISAHNQYETNESAVVGRFFSSKKLEFCVWYFYYLILAIACKFSDIFISLCGFAVTHVVRINKLKIESVDNKEYSLWLSCDFTPLKHLTG